MEHYSLLWQIISITLGFITITSLGQLCYRTGNKAVLPFLIALVFIIGRNIIFTLVRYGNISRFFVLQRNLESTPLGGLIYVSLIYLSHFLLLKAMYRLAKRSISPAVAGAYLLISAFSLTLYLFLVSENWPAFFPARWDDLAVLSVYPVLAVKGLVLYGALRISLFTGSGRESGPARYETMLYLAIGSALLLDGLAYFMSTLSIHFFSLYTVVFYPALLVLLPLIIKGTPLAKDKPVLDQRKIDNLCTEFGFSIREKEIITLIAQGKSNKEIAWAQQANLSKTKRMIYGIYKKCAINSRWELISLLLR
jgi:DNA-binding CsgD family transcriptional regulator